MELPHYASPSRDSHTGKRMVVKEDISAQMNPMVTQKVKNILLKM